MPLISTLPKLPSSDLVDLLALLSGDVDMDSATLSAEQLARTVAREAARISEYQGTDLRGLERHIAYRLANALGVDYSTREDDEEILRRCYVRISDAVVEDMRPFIQVCVCMGWADGKLTPDEIQIMDAALCQLRILRKRRNELMRLCRRPLAAVDLAGDLESIKNDEQKVWSLLALAWSVALADRVAAGPELAAYHELASFMDVPVDTADRIRKLVTKRFDERRAATDPNLGEKIASAAEAAVSAAGLGHYLQAATGLKTLSLLLGRPVESGGLGIATSGTVHKSDWILAPALIAGTLFLRSLRGNADDQKLLLMALAVMEKIFPDGPGS